MTFGPLGSCRCHELSGLAVCSSTFLIPYCCYKTKLLSWESENLQYPTASVMSSALKRKGYGCVLHNKGHLANFNLNDWWQPLENLMFFHKLWSELGLFDLLFIKYICEVRLSTSIHLSHELVAEKLATSSLIKRIYCYSGTSTAARSPWLWLALWTFEQSWSTIRLRYLATLLKIWPNQLLTFPAIF